MLHSLSIRNFALIESLELRFDSGFSVLTGETGAGKSILLEALGFLLGERGSSEWLRSGAEFLEVAGEFETKDGPLTLSRRLDGNGRIKTLKNGAAIKTAELRELGAALADFHGQHEHQSLLSPVAQRALLDEFAEAGRLLERTREAWRSWKALSSKLEAMKLSGDERLRRVDLCRFQVSEIDAAALRPEEEAELEAELPRLKHAEKLLSLAARAYGDLYENEGAASETLGSAEKALSEMAALDPELENARAAAARAREAAEEASSALCSYRESIGEDPERVDVLIGRQDELAKLKRKYGATIAAVIAHRDEAAQTLKALENHAEETATLQAALAAAEETARAASEALHEARFEAAKGLSVRVRRELKDLGMERARLSVSVEMEEGGFGPDGADQVEFLIAPNPGEALKPLRGIASGGELARVMLALKTVLSEKSAGGLMIFDEVDAGVGAAVGAAVGAKLAELGGRAQVLCVTHLPQVACRASAHFHVEKTVVGGRTSTSIERLQGEERLKAVARMLGGRAVTPASLKHARELLEAA